MVQSRRNHAPPDRGVWTACGARSCGQVAAVRARPRLSLAGGDKPPTTTSPRSIAALRTRSRPCSRRLGNAEVLAPAGRYRGAATGTHTGTSFFAVHLASLPSLSTQSTSTSWSGPVRTVCDDIALMYEIDRARPVAAAIANVTSARVTSKLMTGSLIRRMLLFRPWSMSAPDENAC
jgi:hypothetical protein